MPHYHGAIKTKPRLVRSYQGRRGYFLKKFLINDTRNLNRWRVTWDAIKKDVRTFVGQPVVLTPNKDHPPVAVQERYRVGTIIDVGVDEVNRKAWQVTKIKDKKTYDMIRAKALRYGSPTVHTPMKYAEFKNRGTPHEETILHRFLGKHDAIVDAPAYTKMVDKITAVCEGDGEGCMDKLTEVSAEVNDSAIGQITVVQLKKRIAALQARMWRQGRRRNMMLENIGASGFQPDPGEEPHTDGYYYRTIMGRRIRLAPGDNVSRETKKQNPRAQQTQAAPEDDGGKGKKTVPTGGGKDGDKKEDKPEQDTGGGDDDDKYADEAARIKAYNLGQLEKYAKYNIERLKNSAHPADAEILEAWANVNIPSYKYAGEGFDKLRNIFKRSRVRNDDDNRRLEEAGINVGKSKHDPIKILTRAISKESTYDKAWEFVIANTDDKEGARAQYARETEYHAKNLKRWDKTDTIYRGTSIEHFDKDQAASDFTSHSSKFVSTSFSKDVAGQYSTKENEAASLILHIEADSVRDKAKPVQYSTFARSAGWEGEAPDTWNTVQPLRGYGEDTEVRVKHHTKAKYSGMTFVNAPKSQHKALREKYANVTDNIMFEGSDSEQKKAEAASDPGEPVLLYSTHRYRRAMRKRGAKMAELRARIWRVERRAELLEYAGNGFQPDPGEEPDENGYYWRTIMGKRTPLKKGDDVGGKAAKRKRELKKGKKTKPAGGGKERGKAKADGKKAKDKAVKPDRNAKVVAPKFDTKFGRRHKTPEVSFNFKSEEANIGAKEAWDRMPTEIQQLVGSVTVNPQIDKRHHGEYSPLMASIDLSNDIQTALRASEVLSHEVGHSIEMELPLDTVRELNGAMSKIPAITRYSGSYKGDPIKADAEYAIGLMERLDAAVRGGARMEDTDEYQILSASGVLETQGIYSESDIKSGRLAAMAAKQRIITSSSYGAEQFAEYWAIKMGYVPEGEYNKKAYQMADEIYNRIVGGRHGR